MASGENHPERVNLLFTSAGRRVELLRAFKQAYRDTRLSGLIVATDIDPLAPALQVADKTFLVPRVSDPDYIPTLSRIVEDEAIDLIFPLIDPDIPVLAEGREALERRGARLGVVPLESARIAHDKWLTYEFLREIDIATPRSWKGEELPAESIAYPLFGKPRSGSAGKQASVINDEAELAYFLRKVPDPLVQEWLPGPEITNDVTCDLDGNVLAVVSRERIEVRWGEVAKGRTVYDERISEACARIAQGLKAIGPITVQCMLQEGEAYFTEINARFGGGLPLGIAAGVPSPRWYLSMAAGLQVEAPPLGSYKVGLYMTRYDESFFLSEDQRADFDSRRLRP